MCQLPAVVFGQSRLDAGQLVQVAGPDGKINVTGDDLGKPLVRVKQNVRDVQPFELAEKKSEIMGGAERHRWWRSLASRSCGCKRGVGVGVHLSSLER